MDETTKAYYDLINRQQQANNEWSARQAQKAMDYQTEMSNTAHQREVKDLIAAGLNPVLSAGGSGATTGSGIAASAGDANVTALYGLAKQAIDANMKQAEAMANQAKSVAAASSGSGSGSSGRGSGSGSGSSTEKYTVDSLRESFKSVLNEIFDGKNGEVADILDLSDLPKGGKLAICAKLRKLFPFLTTNQIYQFMEDFQLWDLPRQAGMHVGSDLIKGVADKVTSAESALTDSLSEVAGAVSPVVRNYIASKGSTKKTYNKPDNWITRNVSAKPSYHSKSSRGSTNSKYRPSQSKK